MSQPSTSFLNWSNVNVKEEPDQNQSLYSESFGHASFVGCDMASESGRSSTFSNSSYNFSIRNEQNLTNLQYALENRMPTDEKLQPKKEEKPVVHRNTGKISVEDFRRRQYLRRARRLSGSLYSRNTVPFDESSVMVTTSLQIEPVLPRTPNDEYVIELSDGEEQEEEEEENNNTTPQQLVVQPKQQPSSPQPSPQQSPHQQIRATIHNPTLNATPLPITPMNAFLNVVIPQTPNILNLNNIDQSVHCDVCNQRYKNRNSFRAHEKTAKHKNNLATATAVQQIPVPN